MGAHRAGMRSAEAGPVRSWLQLARPPNLVTAAADVLAGFGLAGMSHPQVLPWLIGATVCLYAGGVVLNDYFDAELDAQERPERPIPSGRVSRGSALIAGLVLLLVGVGLAAGASPLSGLIALLIAVLAVAYDSWAKPRAWLGPISMAGCRGLNLLLGLSVVPALVFGPWAAVALISVAYIAAVTLASHGEVVGGARRDLIASGASLSLAAVGLVVLSLSTPPTSMACLVFALALGLRLGPAAARAWRLADASSVMAAVKAGVVNLILLDAALAAGRTGLVYPLVIVVLFIPAALLARAFAVT